MATLRTMLLAGAVLLGLTPASAEDAHHPEAPAGQASEGAGQQQVPAANPSATMQSGMMSGDMMGSMMRMMGGQDPMGMMAGQAPMGQTAMGAMAQMMAPEHIEGRLAFLKTELKITPEQEPLWNAFAETLRANARAPQDGMMQMPGGMGGPGGAGGTPLQRLQLRESTLASRLENIRKLKGALVPLYQALDGTQKQMADRLLVPPMMGMM
ncbi:Spy/CpxP family protein refolding chaperone [Sinorhizobium sp. 7-81]|uniref:Spy/CpxP family protein refolding chaperone n=1 Tax=Sinorhizobium sp. 8-89 TaxID=3049089 RepID=UPI0024C3B5BB|nr:Spy/CpxP family protein refolding chaperone [Sinorhizobium sp. 8-89]MDK1491205.1 Spy/CpxP family protein refolding chaperone [Sinorhizobium sp. 8-89]